MYTGKGKLSISRRTAGHSGFLGNTRPRRALTMAEMWAVERVLASTAAVA